MEYFGCMIRQIIMVLVLALAIEVTAFTPQEIQEAEFAVAELQKLSDSGIYRTLALENIISAQFIDGVYYDNLALELELSSPYFKSGAKTEKFSMVVMNHKKDKVTTLAIDEFPVMDDDAIEQFYIQRVEEHRADRDRAFDRLFREAMFEEEVDGNESCASSPSSEVASSVDESDESSAELSKLSLQELHNMLKSKQSPPELRAKVQEVIKKQFA